MTNKLYSDCRMPARTLSHARTISFILTMLVCSVLCCNQQMSTRGNSPREGGSSCIPVSNGYAEDISVYKLILLLYFSCTNPLCMMLWLEQCTCVKPPRVVNPFMPTNTYETNCMKQWDNLSYLCETYRKNAKYHDMDKGRVHNAISLCDNRFKIYEGNAIIYIYLNRIPCFVLTSENCDNFCKWQERSLIVYIYLNNILCFGSISDRWSKEYDRIVKLYNHVLSIHYLVLTLQMSYTDGAALTTDRDGSGDLGAGRSTIMVRVTLSLSQRIDYSRYLVAKYSNACLPISHVPISSHLSMHIFDSSKHCIRYYVNVVVGKCIMMSIIKKHFLVDNAIIVEYMNVLSKRLTTSVRCKVYIRPTICINNVTENQSGYTSFCYNVLNLRSTVCYGILPEYHICMRTAQYSIDITKYCVRLIPCTIYVMTVSRWKHNLFSKPTNISISFQCMYGQHYVITLGILGGPELMMRRPTVISSGLMAYSDDVIRIPRIGLPNTDVRRPYTSCVNVCDRIPDDQVECENSGDLRKRGTVLTIISLSFIWSRIYLVRYTYVHICNDSETMGVCIIVCIRLSYCCILCIEFFVSPRDHIVQILCYIEVTLKPARSIHKQMKHKA